MIAVLIVGFFVAAEHRALSPRVSPVGRGAAALTEPASDVSLAGPARPRHVLFYDARLHSSDLTSGILQAVAADAPFYQHFVANATKVLRIGLASAAPDAVAKPLVEIVKAFEKQPDPLSTVLTTYIESCKAAGLYPCLVIDEVSSNAQRRYELSQHRVFLIHFLFTCFDPLPCHISTCRPTWPSKFQMRLRGAVQLRRCRPSRRSRGRT